MSRAKPIVLVTNDDGVAAPGIQALGQALATRFETVIVAPHRERSAASHGITLTTPLKIRPALGPRGAKTYSVNGTPVDCVKLALATIFRRRMPDLLVSGINLGSNTGINIIYSGTVSAAFEASLHGIPAIATSLDTFSNPDFRACASFTARLAARVLAMKGAGGILLNVNAPNLPPGKIRGVAITSQGRFRHEGGYAPRVDPRGEKYYWATIRARAFKESTGTDSEALKRGMISVTPIQYDVTEHARLDDLRRWDLKP